MAGDAPAPCVARTFPELTLGSDSISLRALAPPQPHPSSSSLHLRLPSPASRKLPSLPLLVAMATPRPLLGRISMMPRARVPARRAHCSLPFFWPRSPSRASCPAPCAQLGLLPRRHAPGACSPLARPFCLAPCLPHVLISARRRSFYDACLPCAPVSRLPLLGPVWRSVPRAARDLALFAGAVRAPLPAPSTGRLWVSLCLCSRLALGHAVLLDTMSYAA